MTAGVAACLDRALDDTQRVLRSIRGTSQVAAAGEKREGEGQRVEQDERDNEILSGPGTLGRVCLERLAGSDPGLMRRVRQTELRTEDAEIIFAGGPALMAEPVATRAALKECRRVRVSQALSQVRQSILLTSEGDTEDLLETRLA